MRDHMRCCGSDVGLSAVDFKIDTFAHFPGKWGRTQNGTFGSSSPVPPSASPVKSNTRGSCRWLGRTVASVTIGWEEKPQEAKLEAKRELDRPKVGRAARRDGRTETLAPPFPATGRLSRSIPLDAHWRALFEANVTRIQGGHLPDSKLVCDAFRKVRGDRLGDTTTEKHFINFCKAWRG